MNVLHRLVEKIRKDEPIPLVLAGILNAAALFIQVGMWVRLRGQRVRVEAHVISFGNITAGGTGKTPAVIERTKAELAAGRRVAVLTRGYGGERSRSPKVLDTRVAAENACRALGDEPALIARKAPGVVIVKCADRVAAARTAVEQSGCDTLILDDGFQYVRLERDENILLVDAANPFGNGRLIPRGILREPLEAARRATAVVLTRCDQAANLPELVAQLGELCPGASIRKTRHAPRALWRPADDAVLPLGEISGKEIRAVCAIGHPEAFFRTLETTGARVTERVALPDHSDMPVSVLATKGVTVTTEKDAVRIEHPPTDLLALRIELEDYE